MGKWAALFGLSILCGCGDDHAELVVFVKTDLVPGLELAHVETVIRPGTRETDSSEVVAREEVTVDRNTNWLDGARVAEVTLTAGSYVLDIRVKDYLFGTVLRRPVVVDLPTGRTAATVVLTRDCRGPVCPQDTACLGGECVDPTCRVESREECEVLPCDSTSDCPLLADCAEPSCVDNACLYAERSGACGPGLLCQPAMGCVVDTRPGIDAGMEMPMDAARDAGPMDSGPIDTGPPDIGTDIGPPTCSNGCNDSNPCTEDMCVAGECMFMPVPTGPVPGGLACGATGPCIESFCDGAGNCESRIPLDRCNLRAGAISCADEGWAHPLSDCFVCDPTMSQTQWSPASAGTQCNGGTCDSSGLCVQSAAPTLVSGDASDSFGTELDANDDFLVVARGGAALELFRMPSGDVDSAGVTGVTPNAARIGPGESSFSSGDIVSITSSGLVEMHRRLGVGVYSRVGSFNVGADPTPGQFAAWGSMAAAIQSGGTGARLFERNAGTWMEIFQLARPIGAGDEWGHRMDFNGRLFVTGGLSAANRTLSVYSRQGGDWSETASLTPPVELRDGFAERMRAGRGYLVTQNAGRTDLQVWRLGTSSLFQDGELSGSTGFGQSFDIEDSVEAAIAIADPAMNRVVVFGRFAPGTDPADRGKMIGEPQWRPIQELSRPGAGLGQVVLTESYLVVGIPNEGPGGTIAIVDRVTSR